MRPSKWDSRIARAAHLAKEYPFAKEALEFFQAVSKAQAQVYAAMESRLEGLSGTAQLLRDPLPPEEMFSHFPLLLSSLEGVSPEPLMHSARVLRQRSSDEWRSLFGCCWQSSSEAPPFGESEIALARMFLQPIAESLAEHRTPHSNGRVPAACPYCLEKPTVGVLRPEGDGGKRSLICSLCATEWSYGRILCPACGEQNVEKLAVYTTDQFQHVRIEACDSCRYYIKTVDLTKTGRAVPVVDELATIPLNLWARDHGYKKLQPNILGL